MKHFSLEAKVSYVQGIGTLLTTDTGVANSATKTLLPCLDFLGKVHATLAVKCAMVRDETRQKGSSL